MGERPKVSVIIPAYNHEQYISEAVQSVLTQTFEDFELIIIDDGSTDNTFAELEKITDPRAKVLRHENQGAARTINKGISLARGEYTAILNSDDVFLPQRLAVMSSYLDRHPEILLVSSLVQPIDHSGSGVLPGAGHDFWLEWYQDALKAAREDDSPAHALLKHNFIVSTSNIFIRTSYVAANPPFKEFLAYCHDYEFLLRAVRERTFYLIEENLLKYRLHPWNAIRENEFLRRLEIIYSLAHSLNFKDLFSQLHAEKRKEHPLFRGLMGNPEMEPVKRLAELEEIIHARDLQLLQADSGLRERDAQLQQADSWLRGLRDQFKALQDYANATQKSLDETASRLYETESRLQEAGFRLQETESRLQETGFRLQEAYQNTEGQRRIISNQQREVEARERMLQEIYSSRGWRLVLKLRAIRLFLQRIRSCCRKSAALHPHPGAADERIHQGTTDEKTYHAKVLCPAVHRHRPKVIHVIANLLVGGSSRLVVDLIEHLSLNYDQEVVSDLIPDPLAYSGFPLHDFSGSPGVEEVIAFLKRKETKILHVHYWGDKDEPWYRTFFEASEHVPCNVIENVNTLVPTFLNDRIDTYVYVSECARTLFPSHKNKSVVIYPGSNFSLFSRGQSPIPDDVIGMVYRLEPDKLSEDSILPFIHVVKQRPQTKALIVGGGSLLEPFRARVREEGMEEKFEFTGYVPYEQLPEFYRRLSIFIAPIWNESFGQVSPFAMGMRIPVVGYKVGALPEILGGTECLASTAEELVHIVTELLEQREKRIIIGSSNYERAAKLFSVEAMVRKYDELYARLLDA